MKFDPEIHHRRSVRLAGYDYAQSGAYYVTVCAHDRGCLFGEVVTGEMKMNDFGKTVFEEWHKTSKMRPRIRLDAFMVMPNHVHGILVIDDGSTWQPKESFDRPARGRGTLHVPPLSPIPMQHFPADRQIEQLMPDSIPAITSDRGTCNVPLRHDNAVPRVEQFGRSTSDSIPTIVRLFKSAATAHINQTRNRPGLPVWQRNYYEHIIRDEVEWSISHEYIETNPARWAEDRENPNAKPK